VLDEDKYAHLINEKQGKLKQIGAKCYNPQWLLIGHVF
jgi:hypothetical protein